MSTTVVMKLHTPDEDDGALLAWLTRELPATRRFEGCESVVVHRDDDDPARLLVIERWASRRNHEAYIAWRTEHGELAALLALVCESPVLRYLSELDV